MPSFCNQIDTNRIHAHVSIAQVLSDLGITKCARCRAQGLVATHTQVHCPSCGYRCRDVIDLVMRRTGRTFRAAGFYLTNKYLESNNKKKY